ncbi:MAG: alpha-galactosidase [Tannerella sp.]|jgi:alpha-galactosidase|nr:alpha-galactosidase [Tannerella sp.]
MKSIPLLIAFIFMSFAAGKATDVREMQAGKWTIRYDLDSGIADFLYQGTPVLINTAASGAQDCRNLLITQKGTLTDSAWQDATGNGMKYTVSHEETGGTVRRIFYLYPDADFFITEVAVDGGGRKDIACRSITALDGELTEAIADGGAEQRMLSVPFDNDKWVRYDTRPLSEDNVSHEVSAIYDNVSRRGLVIGSIDHDCWKSALIYRNSDTGRNLRFVCGYTSLDTRDLLPHGAVKGKTVRSSRVLIGMFDDWRDGMDAYGSIHATLHGRREWTKKPVGWNSWGKMKFDVTIPKLTETSDYIAAHLQPAGFESADSVFYVDIDSGWNQLDEAGLEAFVRHCKANGQVAGAYFAPYGHWGDNHNAAVGEMPQYRFSDAGLYANGQYLLTVADALALDPTHPAVRKRIDDRIDLIKRLGFKYLKIDFMTQAALEADRRHDPAIRTGMQAYNYALKYLTDKIGDDMYITMAISPLFPAQYVHSRRIACDAWSSIEDTEYTLNGATYGWWLSGAYRYNDPDHIVLENGSDGANRARITSGIITGIVILGDDFSLSGSSTAKRKAMDFLTNPDINRLIKTEQAFRPVEGGASGASAMFTYSDASGFYLALINYDREQNLDFMLDFSRVGLDPQAQYAVRELWSGNAFQAANGARLTLTTRNAAIYQFIKQ